ncbi:hypothetical protein GE061_009957 [Apolygus lucorum]|uniref:Zinc finger protein ush n=1 Tax=Apolygus lucorum TaxID=248454 RepID=A0A8S9Y5U3_APOLU|nr:hypothetical protein GE061_009957 [Apolygus lucorum]
MYFIVRPSTTTPSTEENVSPIKAPPVSCSRRAWKPLLPASGFSSCYLVSLLPKSHPPPLKLPAGARGGEPTGGEVPSPTPPKIPLPPVSSVSTADSCVFRAARTFRPTKRVDSSFALCMGIYVAPAGEEEEWKESNGGIEVKKEEDRESASPAPLLRVNPALATDPAARVPQEPEQASVSSAQEEEEERSGSGGDGSLKRRLEPPTSPTPPSTGRLRSGTPALNASSAAPSASSTTPTASRAHEDLPSPPLPVPTGPPVYFCGPCGIRFSSLSTLEAHQTYYCSHRMHALPRVFAGGGAESESEEAKSTVEKEETSGGESSSEPSGKAARTGKQYKCPHCSYSADKKVSLNRHMRMHSTSPGASERSSSPQPSVDRYCQDCDIRFSSSKTFRAHKMHYCSTRHVVKGKGAPSPESSGEMRPSTPSGGAGSPVSRVDQPQPFLALPTNPILIVPYSLIQSASILPAPTSGLHPPDTAYFLLPDGTLQPMATAIPPPRPLPEKPSRPVLPFHSPPQQPLKPVSEKPKNNEPPSVSPLDLSCRKSAEKEVVVVVDMSEDEKENRQMMNNQRAAMSPEHEDIICAPSIPLMLSTSSTCSSPSPAPLVPSFLVSFDFETKTPNGISSKTSRPDLLTPEAQPIPNKDNSNINLQSLLMAAVSAQSQMDNMQMKSELQNLPFPPEFIPHLTALYNARFGGKSKSMPAIPGLIPPSAAISPHPIPLPGRSPAEFLNQASILLTSEMALRLAAASNQAELPPPAPVVPPPPQVLVKQGDSKCLECNIVFYKHENFIAHKKHYCSARKLAAVDSSQDEKTPSPIDGISPPPTTPPKESKSKSPIGTLNNIPSTSKPTMYQFICAACGIKFTSYDNLTAHQTYYCPKRNPNEPEKPRRCNKCKMAIVGEHHCSGASVGWKCPCCPVTSPTASAAQKHMDTHSGVKAFLCTICRYKGNTLRGMRTHIRMHFDKRPSDVNEENYITCIVEDSPNLMEPSVILEEDVGIQKEVRPPSVSSRPKTPCNGTPDPVRIKQEEVDRVEDEVVDGETSRTIEDEEYIEVEDVTVKEEKVKVEEEEEVLMQSPAEGQEFTHILSRQGLRFLPKILEARSASKDMSLNYFRIEK